MLAAFIAKSSLTKNSQRIKTFMGQISRRRWWDKLYGEKGIFLPTIKLLLRPLPTHIHFIKAKEGGCFLAEYSGWCLKNP